MGDNISQEGTTKTWFWRQTRLAGCCDASRHGYQDLLAGTGIGSVDCRASARAIQMSSRSEGIVTTVVSSQ